MLGARRLAGGGTKHPLAGGRNCLTRLRVINRHACCLGTTTQTLAGKSRAPAYCNKRVLPRLRYALYYETRAPKRKRNRRLISTRGGKAVTELREAFGVRPACWRCRKAGVVRKREQAPRTPNASRGSSSTAILAACGQSRLFQAAARDGYGLGRATATLKPPSGYLVANR